LDNLCLPDEDPLEAVEILPSILSDVPVHVIVKAPQAGEYPNYIEGLSLTFSFVPVVTLSYALLFISPLFAVLSRIFSHFPLQTHHVG